MSSRAQVILEDKQYYYIISHPVYHKKEQVSDRFDLNPKNGTCWVGGKGDFIRRCIDFAASRDNEFLEFCSEEIYEKEFLGYASTKSRLSGLSLEKYGAHFRSLEREIDELKRKDASKSLDFEKVSDEKNRLKSEVNRMKTALRAEKMENENLFFEYQSKVRELMYSLKSIREELENLKSTYVRRVDAESRSVAMKEWAESTLKRERDTAVSDAAAIQEKLIEAYQENATLKSMLHFDLKK